VRYLTLVAILVATPVSAGADPISGDSAKGTDTPMMDWVLEFYLKTTGELHKVVFPTEEECKKAIPEYEALMNGYDGKCVKIKRK
jgi:hypothetical protein